MLNCIVNSDRILLGNMSLLSIYKVGNCGSAGVLKRNRSSTGTQKKRSVIRIRARLLTTIGYLSKRFQI